MALPVQHIVYRLAGVTFGLDQVPLFPLLQNAWGVLLREDPVQCIGFIPQLRTDIRNDGVDYIMTKDFQLGPGTQRAAWRRQKTGLRWSFGDAYLLQRQPGRARPLATAPIYHGMSIHYEKGWSGRSRLLPRRWRLEDCLRVRRDAQGHSGPEGTRAEGGHCLCVF